NGPSATPVIEPAPETSTEPGGQDASGPNGETAPTSVTVTSTTAGPSSAELPSVLTGPVELSTLVITPATVELVAGEQVHLSVQALDSSGTPVTGLSVEWQTTVPSGSVSTDGLFTATAAGFFPDGLKVVASRGTSTVASNVAVSIRPGPLHGISVAPG